MTILGVSILHWSRIRLQIVKTNTLCDCHIVYRLNFTGSWAIRATKRCLTVPPYFLFAVLLIVTTLGKYHDDDDDDEIGLYVDLLRAPFNVARFNLAYKNADCLSRKQLSIVEFLLSFNLDSPLALCRLVLSRELPINFLRHLQ